MLVNDFQNDVFLRPTYWMDAVSLNGWTQVDYRTRVFR